jgi:hypothetical protein
MLETILSIILSYAQMMNNNDEINIILLGEIEVLSSHIVFDHSSIDIKPLLSFSMLNRSFYVLYWLLRSHGSTMHGYSKAKSYC